MAYGSERVDDHDDDDDDEDDDDVEEDEDEEADGNEDAEDVNDGNDRGECRVATIPTATTTRQRRLREWNEEERRRRKEKMQLDIERENMKSLTSPMRRTTTDTAKSGGGFKQISPDDPAAMNVLDGTSPIKTRRFRPKAKR